MPVKFYAVARGNTPGLFKTWKECAEATEGHDGCYYKRFGNEKLARDWLEQQGVGALDTWSGLSDALPDIPQHPGPAATSPQEPSNGVVPPAPTTLSSSIRREIDLSILDSTQREALDMALDGKNLFITGVAGTGKSLLLRALVQELKRDREVAVVAPTGIAAEAVGGTTIHSYCGIGVPREYKAFEKMWGKRDRIRALDVLVVDEVSMLSGELFDFLEVMIRHIRTNPGSHDAALPFGGLQVILCGDFFQLPPVEDRKTHPLADAPDSESPLEQQPCLNRGYCFQAHGWWLAAVHTVQLTTVWRQAHSVFVGALARIRVGDVDEEVETLLHGSMRPLPEQNGVKPTVLQPTRSNVDKENEKELARLPGEEHIYESVDQVQPDGTQTRSELKKHGETFYKNCRAADQCILKEGAQVMLLCNLDLRSEGSYLVNGSRGVVVGWAESSNLVKELEEHISPEQISKLDRDLIRNFLTKNPSALPKVRFQNGREMIIAPHCFRIELMLAWAMTIHKSQGMSLDRVTIDLKDTFSEGQAYVAISRATSLDGLELRGFSRRVVCAHPLVKAFYNLPPGQPIGCLWDGQPLGQGLAQRYLQSVQNM